MIHGVGLAVAGHATLAPLDGFAVGRGERLAVVRPGRQLELGAVGAFDGRHALEASTVQTMVGGGARHHVERALVGFAARVEHAARLGGIGSLHAFSGPVFGPRKAGVAIGVLVDDGVLLVVSSLECIIDGRNDGIRGNCRRGHSVDLCG